MKKIPIALYIFTLLFFTTSCAPEVLSFKAIPRKICEGKATTISWKVKGIGLLTSDPATDNTGSVSNEGSIRFTPLVDTNYAISASRNGEETPPENQYVQVLQDGQTEPIFIETQEPIVDNKLIAVGSSEDGEWGDIKIDKIRIESDRKLEVKHFEKIVNVNPNENKPIEDFKGLSISGPWKISADIFPWETIDNNNFPDSFEILVTVLCPNNKV